MPLVTLPPQVWSSGPASASPGHIGHSHDISTPYPGAKAPLRHSGLLHPLLRGPVAPRPRPHLRKASQQHWYTSKLLLLTVVFRRLVQSTSAPLGT